MRILVAHAEGDVEGFALRAPGNALSVVARGGAGGHGGDNRPPGANVHETSALKGAPGARGHDGPRGPEGVATIERGDVLSHFQDLGAIVPL